MKLSLKIEQLPETIPETTVKMSLASKEHKELLNEIFKRHCEIFKEVKIILYNLLNDLETQKQYLQKELYEYSVDDKVYTAIILDALKPMGEIKRILALITALENNRK